MLHNAIHFFDLVHLLAGPATEVFARSDTLSKAASTAIAPQTVSVSLRFHNGATGSLLLSSLGSWDYPNEHIDIVGSNENALSISNGSRVQYYQKGEDRPTELYENTLSVHWWSGNEEQGFVHQLRAFAGIILGTTGPRANPEDPRLFVARAEDGIRSLLMLEAMRRSIADGSNIPLPISLIQ